MGDVASSLFALGYHERIDEEANNIPTFLAELRRACLARIYAADKSLAIFLGRPPRIVKEYCFLQLPAPTVMTRTRENNPGRNFRQLPTSSSESAATTHDRGMDLVEAINYTADTRCSALFAALKEEILLMFRQRYLNEIEKIRSVSPRSNRTSPWC